MNREAVSDRKRSVRATILVDNTAADGLCGEWGLCVLIEFGEKTILLDAGASDLYLTNCQKLGFDIKDVDYAVLSHAHYDHAGGMAHFFAQNEKASLFVRATTAPNCYARKMLWGTIPYKKYIGIPKDLLAAHADRIVTAEGDVSLCDGAFLLPHKTQGLRAIGEREAMFRRIEKRWEPDDFSHEQSLVLDTDKGLVIFNSCSHGGAANIVREVQEALPGRTVFGYVGGLHLFNKTEEEIRAAARQIKKSGIRILCTGHCTGERAFGILQEEVGDGVQPLRAGLLLEF